MVGTATPACTASRATAGSSSYVSSLDGHVRIFQGETLGLVQDLKIEPGANRLFYDPAANLIYFG